MLKHSELLNRLELLAPTPDVTGPWSDRDRDVVEQRAQVLAEQGDRRDDDDRDQGDHEAVLNRGDAAVLVAELAEAVAQRNQVLEHWRLLRQAGGLSAHSGRHCAAWYRAAYRVDHDRE